VILAQENAFEICKVSELGSILFTPGIYLINSLDFDPETIVGKKNCIDSNEYEKYLNRIRIDPPANYNTRHSIANEWCILRWSEMAVGMNESTRNLIYQNLSVHKSLFFKFLEAKASLDRQHFSRERDRKDLTLPFSEQAKIFYIDDEARKGWGVLFRDYIFKEFSDFAYYDDFIKGESREMLLIRLNERLNTLINIERYNLFIIDLRLCDNDFDDQNELVGFEIIKLIRAINKGIQIVVFTASKQAENVKKALKLGASGYVIKEDPENILTRRESYELYIDFVHKIGDAINKVFLAKLKKDIESIKENNIFKISRDQEQIEFRNTVFSNGGLLDEIFSILNLDYSVLSNNALLICFSILENYAECFGVFEATWLVNDKLGNPSLNYSPNSPQTLFELRIGHYPDIMQNTKIEDETLIGIDFYSTPQTRSIVSKKKAKKPSPILKIATTLKYRDKLHEEDINRLFKLRFIRNNATAHSGNIKHGINIKVDDISFIINNIFKMIFN
jgi:CheY-like chemotaxis protein